MADFQVTGPLDTTLVRVFDRVVDAALELGRLHDGDLPGGSSYEEYHAVHEVALKLGVRLLGSRDLADHVIECLADGPAEGDVLAALSVLWDLGVVDLDSAVQAQITNGPNACVPAEMSCPLVSGSGIYRARCMLLARHDGPCRDSSGWQFRGRLPMY